MLGKWALKYLFPQHRIDYLQILTITGIFVKFQTSKTTTLVCSAQRSKASSGKETVFPTRKHFKETASGGCAPTSWPHNKHRRQPTTSSAPVSIVLPSLQCHASYGVLLNIHHAHFREITLAGVLTQNPKNHTVIRMVLDEPYGFW